ncbi:SLC13 family permease [Cytophagaceae bacterium ABcell3]|nr:SLC13 family permease [Cytophagaceae bacterium ABcell3]
MSGNINYDLILVLGLLVAAIIMFIQNKPRMDAVAIIMIVALPFTGIITVSEALTGFSDPNIILIAVLFILGEGLVRTGVARQIGDWIFDHSRGNQTRLLIMLMLAVGFIGSVMSSTAIVAIFIPIVLRISNNTGIVPSKLMMPLSFAALTSGMMTLVATAPNLVVNSELQRQGHEGFKFFSITPFGLAILVMATLYMLYAKKWLPENTSDGKKPHKPTLGDWIKKYQLSDKEYRVRLKPDSKLIGKNFKDFNLDEKGVSLLAVERREGRKSIFHRPVKQMPFASGDILLLDVRLEEGEITELVEEYGAEIIRLNASTSYLSTTAQEMGMVEAMVPADSHYVGRSIQELHMTSELGFTAVGLWRDSQAIQENLFKEKLKVGDTLLIAGFWEDIKRSKNDIKDFILLNLPAEFEEVLPARSKAPHAVIILLITVGLMVSGVMENVHAVMLGCLALGLFGVVDMNTAYSSISWKSLVLIVGMLPFSIALQRTGGVELAADALLVLVGDSAPRVGIGALFLVTAVLGLFISNTATAVLMAPVGLAMASELGISPYPFAMAITLAASSAFMTPVSSPVNTLVVAPGNYKFGDFIKMGVPFTILILILSIIMIPLIIPF